MWWKQDLSLGITEWWPSLPCLDPSTYHLMHSHAAMSAVTESEFKFSQCWVWDCCIRSLIGQTRKVVIPWKLIWSDEELCWCPSQSQVRASWKHEQDGILKPGAWQSWGWLSQGCCSPQEKDKEDWTWGQWDGFSSSALVTKSTGRC